MSYPSPPFLWQAIESKISGSPSFVVVSTPYSFLFLNNHGSNKVVAIGMIQNYTQMESLERKNNQVDQSSLLSSFAMKDLKGSLNLTTIFHKPLRSSAPFSFTLPSTFHQATATTDFQWPPERGHGRVFCAFSGSRSLFLRSSRTGWQECCRILADCEDPPNELF